MAKIKVRYRNDLNLIPMRNFEAKEMDLFFSICAKMKDKGTAKVRFDFEQLRELSAYKPTSLDRFSDSLESVYDKMMHLSYRTETEDEIERFALFTGFKISKKEQYVEISVNPDLEHLINRLTKEFTKFELEEFTEIRSSYAKTMYRLLKQFKSTGFYKVKIEEFRTILDIPESYKMGNIDQRVLKPIKDELAPYFDDLKIIKHKARKENKIAVIEFRFKEKKSNKKFVPLHNWLEESN
uniref:replication initiation protein n=1 Tax=Carnobacterium sp. TaxID=48221 RepID=UPI001597F123|nr:replication initiation protein [Carnobacterium sp.]QJS06066.1 replication protein [Carnobacterium sp.]